MSWLLLLPLAYLIGTFPSAELVARANGFDIRQEGSGNPGASNVTRMLGWRWGAPVMVIDALKGAIPTAIGLLVDGRGLAFAMLAAAVVGHMFPIWRHLRGGKGVATVAGGYLVLIPIGALALFAVWFAVSKLTGKASVASLVMVGVAPIVVWLSTHSAWEVSASIGIGVLVAARHADNVKRLLRHGEPSIRA